MSLLRFGLRRGNGLSAPVMLLLVLAAVLWPKAASAWWNDQWTLRKKITIDTGQSGAGISDAIGTAPILVRLHVGNFRFGAAKDDGGDLRFIASDDKTPLKHHVEKYDSLLGEALVWVSVPDLKPGTKNDIWLYYGNQKAPTAIDAKGTYDPDTLLVYHFNDRGTPAQDVTAWANSAQNAVPAADGAIIGQGARPSQSRIRRRRRQIPPPCPQARPLAPASALHLPPAQPGSRRRWESRPELPQALPIRAAPRRSWSAGWRPMWRPGYRRQRA